jgi:hypothetical protein
VDRGYRLHYAQLCDGLCAVPGHLQGQLDPVSRMCSVELRRMLG